ncbi:ead/Ea22-like family protein [Citrobacter freundii]|uniref:ead/Ea22-like family protein n=1 Tax=Citrobacter freundii TaxID=546 RepID=UPI001C7D52C8|nr:ead/Ea22-like family protein [Citrobacter freundii]
MSNIDKRALREAAEKATPGRWEYYPGNTSIEYNVDSMDEDQGSIVYVDSGDFTQKQTDLNGTFIAAANPSNVLALLDELEAAEKRIDELSASHSKLRDTIAAIHNTIRMDGGYTPLAAILNAAKRAHEESASAAGIGVNGE